MIFCGSFVRCFLVFFLRGLYVLAALRLQSGQNHSFGPVLCAAFLMIQSVDEQTVDVFLVSPGLAAESNVGVLARSIRSCVTVTMDATMNNGVAQTNA